jgi:hypothetical protein
VVMVKSMSQGQEKAFTTTCYYIYWFLSRVFSRNIYDFSSILSAQGGIEQQFT